MKMHLFVLFNRPSQDLYTVIEHKSMDSVPLRSGKVLQFHHGQLEEFQGEFLGCKQPYHHAASNRSRSICRVVSGHQHFGGNVWQRTRLCIASKAAKP